MDLESSAEAVVQLSEKQLAAKAELIAAGDTAFDEESFERALDCYHRASLIDDADARIWNSLGMTYHNLEFSREAWRSYKLALNCDANNLETLWYAGEFLHNMDDSQLALVLLTRYMDLETDDEKREDAEELIAEIREELAVQSSEGPLLADPNEDPLEQVEDDDELEGFEIDDEEPEQAESEFDEFDDEFHEGDDEVDPEDGDEFMASLSLELTRMDSKCTSCQIPIPQDAPSCYSCKAPHFYE